MLQRAAAAPSLASPEDILALQRAYGNQAVASLLNQDSPRPSVQPRLKIGPVGDRYEQEADRVADQVIASQPVGEPSAQRQELEEEELQMMPLTAGAFEVSSDLERRLAAQKNSGSSLSPDVRAFMEPRFGADFSDVKVHTGGEAVRMTRKLKARAFTHGQDIYFGAGEYSPGTRRGRRLLAHELTHSMQQGAARMRKRARSGTATPPAPHTSGTAQRELRLSIKGWFSREKEFWQRKTDLKEDVTQKLPRMIGSPIWQPLKTGAKGAKWGGENRVADWFSQRRALHKQGAEESTGWAKAGHNIGWALSGGMKYGANLIGGILGGAGGAALGTGKGAVRAASGAVVAPSAYLLNRGPLKAMAQSAKAGYRRGGLWGGTKGLVGGAIDWTEGTFAQSPDWSPTGPMTSPGTFASSAEGLKQTFTGNLIHSEVGDSASWGDRVGENAFAGKVSEVGSGLDMAGSAAQHLTSWKKFGLGLHHWRTKRGLGASLGKRSSKSGAANIVKSGWELFSGGAQATKDAIGSSASIAGSSALPLAGSVMGAWSAWRNMRKAQRASKRQTALKTLESAQAVDTDQLRGSQRYGGQRISGQDFLTFAQKKNKRLKQRSKYTAVTAGLGALGGALAMATPAGWALAGAGALVGAGVAGHKLWRWGKKRWGLSKRAAAENGQKAGRWKTFKTFFSGKKKEKLVEQARTQGFQDKYTGPTRSEYAGQLTDWLRNGNQQTRQEALKIMGALDPKRREKIERELNSGQIDAEALQDLIKEKIRST